MQINAFSFIIREYLIQLFRRGADGRGRAWRHAPPPFPWTLGPEFFYARSASESIQTLMGDTIIFNVGAPPHRIPVSALVFVIIIDKYT